jgi:ATP-dependent RNA helicase RhlE
MALLPKKRQNLMFSATFSNEIRQLAKGIINNPIEIDVAPRNSTVEKISQIVHPVDKARKVDLLSHLIKEGNWYQVLVFARTKHGSDKLVKKLSQNNINAAAIHGNKSQSQRTKALADFKQNKIQVLVATDIASRGIDIDQLSHVVNFDLPNVAEDYVHRIGRTGRAGASGHAVSLVSADEIKQLQDIEKLIKFKIERKEIEDFEPEHNVPESIKPKPSSNRSRPNNNRSNNNNTSNKNSPWKGAKKKTRSKDGQSNTQSKNKNNNKTSNRNNRLAKNSAVS